MVEPHPITLEEIESERDGARRVYRVRVPGDHVSKLTASRVKEIGQSVRLPGFRPGKIPDAVLAARYGSKARAEVVRRLQAEAGEKVLSRSELPASTDLVSGDSAGDGAGDVEFRLVVTHLPDLAPMDFETLKLERLSASPELIVQLGLSSSAAEALFENHLRQQVLDSLSEAYQFPVAKPLIAREYALISPAAEAAIAADFTTQADREAIAVELFQIAERRVRLGAVVMELARRHEIKLSEEELARERLAHESPVQTRDRLRENRLIQLIVSKAQLADRDATSDEVRDMADAAG